MIKIKNFFLQILSLQLIKVCRQKNVWKYELVNNKKVQNASETFNQTENDKLFFYNASTSELRQIAIGEKF